MTAVRTAATLGLAAAVALGTVGAADAKKTIKPKLGT
jgi:hypothetical protein